ncbi:MAG: hypothetical protein QOI24_4274 [Acidobacteriota bacterium]|jgi:hypothetical protein|nr:hypothetical protein [Acidobacteriota bacterium]
MRYGCIAIALALAAFITSPVFASCGSATCPLDLNALNRPVAGGFSLDLSFEYIDQSHPRIGTHSAHVGELHDAHHDEVRTVNRSINLLLCYGVNDRLQFSLGLPFINRFHEHLASNHTHASEVVALHNVIPESWSFHGVGDLMLQGRYALMQRGATESLWATGGIKLPTGAHDRANDDGELAEPSIQPGTGSTDFVIGLSYEKGLLRTTAAQGSMGNVAMIPLFISATYRRNGRGTEDFRAGSEWQLSAGSAYPIVSRLELLGQLNARRKSRDFTSELNGLDPFTGGTFVYASPGLRWSSSRGSLYALVQIPLYRDVNGIQLTSNHNFVMGVQTRF